MAARPLLVTGAAGFVGARFVERCHARSIPIVSVDSRAHFVERAEHKVLDFGEIVDREELLGRLASKPMELAGIVHMGACTDTTELDLDYLRRVNVEYSQALWNHACDKRLPLVYASSAATYGAGEQGYTDDEAEMKRLVPLNPYGDSKLQFDLWALGEEKKRRTPPSWSGFKFFNVYGFGERHKAKMASVVMHAFDQINATGKVRLFKSHKAGIADGHQARDFVYVDDVIDVLTYALEKPLGRGIYNLGTGRARTFLDLVNATFAAMGKKPQIEFFDTPMEVRARYQYFTQADMLKLRRAGWMNHFTTLEDGVKQYVERLSKLA